MLRLFDFVATEGGPISVVWKMLANLLPEYLGLGIPIGLLLGKVDFSDLKIVLAPEDAATKTAEVAIAYGAFINTVIQFVIVAMAVFLLVKLVNAARRNEAEGPAPSAPPAPTPSEELLTEIRDLLAAQRAAPPVARVVPVKAEVAATKAVVRKPAVKKPAAPKKA
jgi:large conductance mechanosensitive channel